MGEKGRERNIKCCGKEYKVLTTNLAASRAARHHHLGANNIQIEGTK